MFIHLQPDELAFIQENHLQPDELVFIQEKQVQLVAPYGIYENYDYWGVRMEVFLETTNELSHLRRWFGRDVVAFFFQALQDDLKRFTDEL